MKKLLFMLLAVAGTKAYSQSIIIDLSQNVNVTFTQTINPQTVSVIILKNRSQAAGVTYSINATVKQQAPATLNIPNLGVAAGAGAPPPAACTQLNTDITKLLNQTDETQVPTNIATLQNDINIADATTCAGYISLAKQAITAATDPRVLPQPLMIKSGAELDVTITSGTKIWTYAFVTQQSNHWMVSYGLTYIPDILTHFPEYYANPQSGGTYLIARMNSSTRNTFQNLSPSLMLTYRFFKQDMHDFNFGLTSGFAYNSQNMGGSFGPSLVIGNLVAISTGLTFVQKYQLMGQYLPGQTINDNLSFSQLHNQVWTYDLYFSISFNLPQLFTKNNTGSNNTPATSSGTH
ncbi:hypothetical protein HDF24_05945 [Mucilaginibacter sp. X4EP1]|uniref:hypothetical protein n=1 Tax=Mucilaginibacter sp. X4EP1 TaxID=2723092 RepID=UPI0021670D35|nr:hypothetical protein [Mucilaginibacter sp. X4EP1]MCS3814360.1 hypothetical protein [Mucilaginibacter sp. X4EP1]